MLRKVTRDGYGYSVVDLNDVRHVLAVAIPGNGGDLQEQAHDALRTIQAVHDEENTGARLSIRQCSWPIRS
jgi:hypothetical protein